MQTPQTPTTPETLPSGDEMQERLVIGGALILAIGLAVGIVADRQGLLDQFFGAGFVQTAKPVLQWIHTEAGGDPSNIMLSGFVADEKTRTDLEASLKKEFPKSEIQNLVHIDAGEKSKVEKKKKKTGDAVLRVSFAADAPNELWPRPRFGEVKRLELVWKDELVTARGAIFGHRPELEAAFAKINKKNRGVLQFRDSQRPNVSPAQLQNDVSTALAGRVIAFDAAGAIDAKDANSAAIVAAVAPVLKDLTGLEVWISAGADDRLQSAKQAEAVKAALVAAGVDVSGLRAVPAMKSNPLMFIVREKD